MLVDSPRISPEDRTVWNERHEADNALAKSRKMAELEERALLAILGFLARGPAYAGVSWGKDSVVLAHLVWRCAPETLVAWFPAGKIENPDCAAIRDEFLSRFPVRYCEIEAAPTSDITLAFFGHDGAQKEFERVSRQLGQRYLSGVRSEESATRKRRMMQHGESTENTCAPIGWWPTDYVFAYLAKYDLPTHPVYAMTLGGTYDRNMLRVGTLGGYRGTGNGRREHERHYYRDEMIALGLGGDRTR